VEQQEQYLASHQGRGKLIEVKMTKTTLYIYEQELSRLLAKDPELWREAIKRGKFALRRKKEQARQRG